ncbi:MAG: hypothetical protein ACI4HL_05815 [Ruminococcus sp.]
MSRLTFREDNGVRGLKCAEINNLPECICRAVDKLADYEDTGFTPGEIEGFAYRINSLTERCNSLEQQVKSLAIKNVTIGTEIAGYRIFAISGKRCVAQRIKKMNCADYVVWHLEPDGKGVSSGVYFTDRAGAVDYFAGVI